MIENQQGTVKCERRFLLHDFPPGLLNNSKHIQIKDNYISNTRLRLRKIRVPETRERSWLLSQKLHQPGELSNSVDVYMSLSPLEYEVLSVFEGNEVRKNRYPYEHEGRPYSVDFYLGALWGLLIAKTSVAPEENIHSIAKPDFAIADISDDPMFSGPRLAELTIEEIRARFQ